MHETSIQGTRALIALSVALAACLGISVAAAAGFLDELESPTWREIVVNARDVITHE